MPFSLLPQMASALAFRTIFSMIPVLVIGLAVIGAFADAKDTENLIGRVLDFTGLSRISIEQAAGAGDSSISATPFGNHAALDDWIRGLVAKVQSIPFKTIGGIGLLLLAYAAMAMLVEVERAFNRVYHVPTPRPWVRRIAPYWTLLTLGGVFLAATFYIGDRTQQIVAGLIDGGTGVLETADPSVGGAIGGIGKALLMVSGYLVTVCISTLLLVVAYTTLPNTKVRLWPAVGGALVAAILWEAGKWGFIKYLKFSTSYARFYDQLALIPLFMLWVYLTWMVVLLGLQVSHALQNYDAWEREERDAKEAGGNTGRISEAALVDPAMVIPLVVFFARRFQRAEAADAAQAAAETNLDPVLVVRLADGLTRARFLRRVEDGEAHGYSLCRPAEAILLRDLLTVGHEVATAAHADQAASTARKAISSESIMNAIRRAQLDAVGITTVADLLATNQQEPDAAPIGSPEPTPA